MVLNKSPKLEVPVAVNRGRVYDDFMNGTCRKSTLRASSFMLLAIGLITINGCVVLKKGPVYVPLHHPNYPMPTLPKPKKADTSNANTPRPALIQVMEINLPLGKFSQNAKIWKLLTKAPAGPRTIKLLAANGFKIGDGTFTEWPAIRKLINAPGLSTEAVYCQIANIAPVVLDVHSNIRNELLTYHTAAEPLVVRTYQNCDDQFLIAANTNRALGLTVISLEPAVKLAARHSPTGPGLIRTQQGSGPVRHVFSNIQFSFLLQPQHFVVLAPLKISALNNSIGTCFLTQQNHVPRRETVLFLVPLNIR